MCLLDECGHLPMIERTAEFNAQVLAFLTGDARYLEYVEAPSEAEEDIGGHREDVEETESDLLARDGEASQPLPPDNEPTDLPPQFPSSDDSVPETPSEERPTSSASGRELLEGGRS